MEHLERDIQQARTRLGRNVREGREAAGLSLAEFARRTGIDERKLADIEAGTCDVPFDTIVQLARTLHVTLSELFTT